MILGNLSPSHVIRDGCHPVISARLQRVEKWGDNEITEHSKCQRLTSVVARTNYLSLPESTDCTSLVLGYLLHLPGTESLFSHVTPGRPSHYLLERMLSFYPFQLMCIRLCMSVLFCIYLYKSHSTLCADP